MLTERSGNGLILRNPIIWVICNLLERWSGGSVLKCETQDAPVSVRLSNLEFDRPGRNLDAAIKFVREK